MKRIFLAMALVFGLLSSYAFAADTVAPTVSSMEGPRGTGVSFNRQLSATFSEKMDPATIVSPATTFELKESLSGNIVAGIVTYVGLTATFKADSDLLPGTKYIAKIKTSARDLAGNRLASVFVWSFTTGQAPDTTAPRVRSTIPADAAADVRINKIIIAPFTETMDPATINRSTFDLTGPGATRVLGTVTLVRNVATFRPANDLDEDTLFTATIKGGPTGAKDLAGNALANDYVWAFTTGVTSDTNLPAVISTNPADVAIGVCINKAINVNFSEPMDPKTIDTATFTVTDGVTPVIGTVHATGKTASFKSRANLAAGSLYTVTIKGGGSGVKDLAGNALLGGYVWTFTTGSSACTKPPALGTARSFGAFGGSATLTNDGLNTLINGDIGVNGVSTAITGLRDTGGNVYTVTTNNDGMVNGRVYTLTDPPGSVAGAAAAQVSADALAAFNSISPASLPGGIDVSSLAQCPSCGGVGEGPDALAGRTLPPGVYMSTTGVYDIGKLGRVQTTLTLDARGDSGAVWIFQTAAGTGTLTVGLTGPAAPAVPVKVRLINGASAGNVFWYVPAGATIGTGSTMVGTMLSDASITISTTGGTPPSAPKTVLDGRALALTAAVTMVNTVINVPAQ